MQGFVAAQGLHGLQGLHGFAAAQGLHGLQGLQGFLAAQGLQAASCTGESALAMAVGSATAPAARVATLRAAKVFLIMYGLHIVLIISTASTTDA